MVEGITDEQFQEEVLEADKPVLVKFWAEWCKPCMAMQPIFEEVAQDYAEIFKFVKLNIDDNPNTPPSYGVRGVPMMLLFEQGNIIAYSQGPMTASELKRFLNEHA